MLKRIASVTCGLLAGSVSLALFAMPYPAVAQSAEELRAEVEALRRENATLRERHRLARENAALQEQLARRPAPAPVARGQQAPVSAAPPAAAPHPREAYAADMPLKAPAPPVVAAPSWAGFYIGVGVSRDKRNTRQGTETRTSDNGVGGTFVDNYSLDQEAFVSAAHVVGGWLWQYQRLIVGLEGDYYFGGRTERQPGYLVPPGCSAAVPLTGMFGCGSATAFGSFETKGHVRGIIGAEITPRFMAFAAGGLAIGQLGAGGIQVGGIVVDSPSDPGAATASSTYGRKTLFGTSWGGGVQVKLNESLVGRVEYLRDEYKGPTQGSVTATAASAPSFIAVTSNPQTIRIVNESLRASLIYRFDPNVSIYEAARRDVAAFGRWDAANSFAGFYAGVGISQNNYDYRMPGAATLTINDANTPGTDISERTDLSQQGAEVGKNFMVGYRFQWQRFLVGVEREFVRGSKKVLDHSESTGLFGSDTHSFTCYQQFQPNIVCISLKTANGVVETRGRLRFVGGFELTPSLMAFVGYGRAYGRAQGTNGGASGLVFVSPNVPLVGAATVSRNQANDITGTTWGGGFELKATESISFRADYWRDTYTWNAIVCGGAGFGGTTGNITVNSFASCATPVKIKNEAYQASVIYHFWNPQQSASAAQNPLLAFAQAIPGYSWTGFYAGAHGGYGWGQKDWNTIGLGNEGQFKVKGWLAGAQVGYNYQVNQVVFGVEADGSFTDIHGERISLLTAPGGQPDVIRVDVEGLATFAGRLGFAWNNVLLYGKGGAAWVREHLQYTHNAAGNARDWKGGWVAGAGLEYGISANWSVKAEYNYLDFGTKRYHFTGCNSCPGGAVFDVDLKQHLHVVKLGLNWRFWTPGPLVARY